MNGNPYLEALELMKMHIGTSGQSALAKCVLSLYCEYYAFSASDYLPSLDNEGRALVIRMITSYAYDGETEELRIAGKWCFENFSRLVKLADAMCAARTEVYRQWEYEREEELNHLYPHDES